MPINPIVLQRRHAELGRIRLGHKASTERGGSRPAKLDTFRFTSPNAALIEAIAELYGGEARPWDNGGKAEHEVYTQARSIPVIVVKGGFSQWMETWSGGGCIHRCDGVTNALTGEPCDTDELVQVGRDAINPHNAARPTTRLSVMLRDVESLGVWRMESHGWNAAAELPSMAELAMLVGDLVPANLHLVERSSKVEVRGKVTTSRYVVPVLDLAVSKQRLVQIVAAQSGGYAELDGGSSAPQIEAPRPDYLAEVEAAGSKDDLNAVWRAAGEAGHLGDDLKAAIIARAEQIEPAPEPEHVEGELMDEQPTAAGDPAAAWMAVVTLAGRHGWTTDALVAAFEQELALHPSDASAEQIAAFEADLRAGRIGQVAWHEGPMALFDTETTGIDPREARIVTAAIVETGRGIETRVSEWLLNPGVEIPEGASAIHGITTERAREDGMDAAAGVHEIAEHLLALSRAGVPVVGMNVVYDLTLLWAELDRHGDPIADDVRSIRPVIDALVLDKRVDRYRKGKRTLIDLARHYGVHLDEADAHGATADAIAAGRVARCIAEQSMEVRHMSLDELHRAQVEWKHEQASSLADYWRKQGDPRADEVSTDWPVQGRAS